MSAALRGDEDSKWILVELDKDQVYPRDYPMFCPIGSSEILIMGGDSGDPSYDFDAHVFDTRTETV